MGIDEALRAIIREEIAEALRPPPPRPEWITMTDLASELGVGLPKIHELLKRGCPHIMPDNRPRFNLAEVTQWLRK